MTPHLTFLVIALLPVAAPGQSRPAATPATAPAAPADAAAVAALIERHVAWLGGRAALAGLKDITGTGTVAVRELRGTLRLVAARPNLLRTETDLGAVRETTVIGPDGAFKINVSGQVEPIPAEERARHEAETARMFGLHLQPDAKVRRELLPDETRDGRTWSVLRIDYGGGIRYDLLIDPRDGSLTWSRERNDHGEVSWTRLGDWRKVGELRLPFSQEVQRERAEDNSRIEWQEVQLDSHVAAAQFARPASRPSLATFTDGLATTGWLPMTLYLDRYIYLRGTINGRVTDIVLDSGAGATVVDGALAEELGLRTQGQVSARGVGGVQSASFLAGVEIRLGNLALRGIQAVKLDMGEVGRMLGRGMPVILGKEAFQATVVDIDYPNARIAFHDPASYRYAGTGHTVPLLAGGHGHRHIELTIEDGPRGVCTLDTGSGAALSLFRAFCDEHKLLDGRTPLSESQSGGVGGKTVSQIGTLKSVTFAGFRLERVPATFGSDAKGGAFDNDRLAGNLGAGIFARFRMVFDYGREVLHVEPGADWERQAFRKDRVGISGVWQEGALVIRFVPPGSPAARAGLKPGDRITQLDGKPIEEPGWRATVLQHTNVAAGTEVRLTDHKGREIRLVAADYY